MAKGILLTGGEGTRLRPQTYTQNKHLLYLNKKFIIDYPLNTLKQLGCDDIIVVLGGSHYSQIVSYLKDGKEFGVNLSYIFQPNANGIAAAINLCKNLLKDELYFSVVLGDNIFENSPKWDQNKLNKAQIMLADHPSLNRFGVASLSEDRKIIKIEEKPKTIDINYHNYAVSGCYLFNQMFFEYFQELKPSARQEFEVIEIINKYHNDNNLSFSYVNGLWSDAGTHESISYLNHYFYTKEHGIVPQ